MATDATIEAAKVSGDAAKYATLVQDLIVQGLLKLNETTVEIRCRQMDISVVEGVKDAAIAEYTQILRDVCGETVRRTHLVIANPLVFSHFLYYLLVNSTNRPS